MDCTVVEACLHADIVPDTYYRWIKANPELSDRFQRLKNKPFLKARTTIMQGIETNPDFALKYMKNKKNDEFNEKTVQEVNATINQEVIDDELDKVIGGEED